MYNYYGDTMKHIRIRRWVKVLFFLILIFTITYLYGRYVEPKNIIVKEYSIVNSNIPDNFYGFKIVQISDINYGVNNDKDTLDKLVKKINLLKPDIVILSGDLFYNGINYMEEDYKDLTEFLNNISYNIGKYAIKGENDVNSKWEEIINNSNFTNLNDRYEFIYNEGIDPILLVGISSNYSNNHIKETIDNMSEIINTDYYSILVLHEPDFINYIDYSKFNLILSGHSLNGIIKIPYIGGIIKNKYSSIYFDEYYDLGNTKMYISSGIGTNKHKIRILNKPSISLYRLRNK